MSVTLIVDGLAAARLARLVTADTFPPVRALRERVLDRWPAPGQPVTEAQVRRGIARHGADAEADATHLDYDDLGVQVPVWTHGTPIGELVTCPWCASVWLAAGIVVLRRVVPGVWDPIARLLAFSEAAGLAAEVTS